LRTLVRIVSHAVWRYVPWVTAVVLLDQSLKLYVKTHYYLGASEPLLGNRFRLLFVENPGAAFGLSFRVLGIRDTATANALLTVVAFGVAVCVAVILVKISRTRTRLPVFLALVLGGALGNLIDRVGYGVWFAARNEYVGGWLRGRVVDMLYLDVTANTQEGDLTLPVFNLADVAILVGTLLLLLHYRRWFPAAPTRAEADAAL